MENYADLNSREERTGFTPIMMACHLNTESDSLRIIKMLCKHRHYPDQPQLVDVDAQDLALNTALHHAALTNKLSVCEYLINTQNVKIGVKNQEKQQAIDLTTSEDVEKFLSNYQTKSENSVKKQGKFGKLKQWFTKKKSNPFLDLADQIEQDRQKAELGGRRQIQVRQSVKQEINIDYFKILDKLGNGAFGYVYCVCPKKLFKNPLKLPNQLYAMKILEKEKVIQQNLARYALTERNVLSIAGRHPLIVGLDYAFQNQHRLYLIMEYCPGGDLGKQIKLKRKLSEYEARLYICEVILAIEFLHKNNIIFRDLKPENIVLDRNGHVKLTDFGLSKENVGNLFDNNSFVGSIAYLAPEILKKQPHSKSIDWYLTGVLLYEMLVGIPPYYNNNRKILFENIQSGPLRIPHTMSLDARDLILNLLNRNPRKRLGASEADSEELKRH